MNRPRPKRSRANRLLPLLALVVGAHAAAAQIMRPEGPPIDWEQRLGERVPAAIELTDSDGAVRRMDALLAERPAILALVYYDCPMLCNEVLDGLMRSLRAVPMTVGADFDVLVVSIDPDETVEQAAARRAAFAKDDRLTGDPAGWHFLVGHEDAVRALAGAVGFSYTYIPETDEYAHPAGITVLSRTGVVSRVLFGIEFAPRDVKFALIEAGEGRIGSPVDKVLLRCFAYDPAHGKYGFAVFTAVRIAGASTVAVLALFIWRSLRRERRARSAPPGGTAALHEALRP